MRIRHIRVRIKELASEARHIRHEEHQCSGMERWRLQDHRKTVVRSAARKYQLAYAAMRGVPYATVESHVRCPVRAKWVLQDAEKIAVRFGMEIEEAKKWTDEAREYLKVVYARLAA